MTWWRWILLAISVAWSLNDMRVLVINTLFAARTGVTRSIPLAIASASAGITVMLAILLTA
jgi:hypothetical protein